MSGAFGDLSCTNCNVKLVEVVNPRTYQSTWLHQGLTKQYRKCWSRNVATPFPRKKEGK